jgi:hypothetical protein
MDSLACRSHFVNAQEVFSVLSILWGHPSGEPDLSAFQLDTLAVTPGFSVDSFTLITTHKSSPEKKAGLRRGWAHSAPINLPTSLPYFRSG